MGYIFMNVKYKSAEFRWIHCKQSTTNRTSRTLT